MVSKTVKGFGRKLAVGSVAVGAAAGVAFGPGAPDASALNINQQVYTAGPLLSVLPLVGVDSLDISLGDIPVIGPSTLTLGLVPTASPSMDLYNTVNALGFSKRNLFGTPIWDRIVAETGAYAGNFPMVVGTGPAAQNLVEAYRAQISSVNGATPPGYTPFQPGPIVSSQQTVNNTNQVLGFLNNSLRPNGGLQTRFAPILNLFGVDTTVPAAGAYASTGIRLNTATLDATWAYSPLSDFPVTLNPFSFVNSLFATVPISLLSGYKLQGLDTTAAATNVAGVLGILNNVSGGIYGVPNGQGFYGTLVPTDLPILEPLRLPAQIINAITGVDLGTPFADALQPAFKILVNIGYSDVVTPIDIAKDPQTYGQYQAYDRTYLTSGVQQPFLSVAPLTPAEWLQVPGDVVRALFTGFSDAFPRPTMGRPPATPATPTPPASSVVASSVVAASGPEAKQARSGAVRQKQPASAPSTIAAPSPVAAKPAAAHPPKRAAARAAASG